MVKEDLEKHFKIELTSSSRCVVMLGNIELKSFRRSQMYEKQAEIFKDRVINKICDIINEV